MHDVKSNEFKDYDVRDSDGAAEARRRRYARSPSPRALTALTPVRVRMLLFLAELGFLSLPQLARLCCPSGRRDLSERSARRHMRALFDAGLVDVLPVSRAALAPPGAPNDATLLYGSAPNVYAPTARGRETLYRAGLIGKEEAKRPAPSYGPKNSLFLAHELAVRDVRVWLETAACAHGHEVEAWRDGEEAAIGLQRGQGASFVRPDAWFVYRLDGIVLVGLVEVDRGTERGDRRWGEKLAAYGALFADRAALTAATGYVNARVLVLTSDERRRDRLAILIAERAEQALVDRFWLAGSNVLERLDLCGLSWRRPGASPLQSLVPPKL